MSKQRVRSVLGAVVAAAALAVLAGCASHYGGVYSSYGPQWAYGSSFYIGGIGFQVLYSDYDGRHGYYFRTSRFGPGRYCNRYCYRARGRYYHHAGCGHVGRYFGRYGYRVGALIQRYGP